MPVPPVQVIFLAYTFVEFCAPETEVSVHLSPRRARLFTYALNCNTVVPECDLNPMCPHQLRRYCGCIISCTNVPVEQRDVVRAECIDAYVVVSSATELARPRRHMYRRYSTQCCAGKHHRPSLRQIHSLLVVIQRICIGRVAIHAIV